ncbi:RNA-directed DNA polymerase, eukaryota, reverse transcriptase zinc-binding domain protein [Tanacetum coccineum]|uniref:RNA-directed DNA polymerase, eukaryota, reverse transcriptase zinc-binding domain protein n=1 Tax=Tanacetum coccineum TaxID=301880 RepID=A0ABQ5F541_9ASTR
MSRRSKHTFRVPSKLSDSILTMTNNKNKKKDGVMGTKNEDSAMNDVVNHEAMDDESNGRSMDKNNGSRGELCVNEDEFPSLSEFHVQPDGGKVNTEVGEGSGGKNFEDERCDYEESAEDQGRNVVVFDEELVSKGSRKWELTLCGHFVGCKMECEGMNQVLESGPWLVNNKPLMIHKWDPSISINKKEPEVLPCWIKLLNVPLEPWTTKGISTIASGVGKPWVCWKPPVCSNCKVFGYNDNTRGMRNESPNENGSKTMNGGKKDMGVNRKERNGYNRTNAMGIRGQNQTPISNKNNTTKDVNTSTNGNTQSTSGNKSPWRVNKEIVKDIRRSANKYAVLEEMEESDDPVVQKHNSIEIINKYVLNQRQPTIEESKDWTSDMFNYFKEQWEAKWMTECLDEEYVFDELNEFPINVMNSVFRLAGWNVRGLCNKDMQKQVKNFIIEENLSICAALETHVKAKKIRKVCDFVYEGWSWYSNIDKCDKGCRIIVGWKEEDVNLMVIQACKQAVLCLIEIKESNCKFYCYFVYAANFGKERRSLWRELGKYKRIIDDKPWECLEQIEVEDLNCSGIHYTWVQSRQDPSSGILNKIDRVLGNTEFMCKFINSHVVSLPHLTSDHSPAILYMPKMMRKKNKAFRFSNFVADKPNFINIIQDKWNIDIEGHSMFKLVKKLKAMKSHLKNLSWKFGNIFENNSKFFHTVLKGRAYKSRIEIVQNENGDSFEGDQVANKFVTHFQNFLGKDDPVQNMNMESLNPKTVCDEDAKEMIKGVSDVEIKEALFDICDNKAPGPDGYTAKFYKKAWSVVGPHVCEAIKDFFFKNGKLLGEVNATLITLVPKSTTPIKVSDYRPIACCNVLYKIISKILISRIKSALCKIVNPSQSAFIPGRQITDNILLTRELLKGYDWKKGSRRVALKIDIQKAYDTIREGSFKYHWGCKDLQLSHLCFVDDLFVLCHGDTKSVKVVKSAMDTFSSISGLRPNIGKSTIFFGNVKVQAKNEILSILPFKIGCLPVSYLGFLLITKSLTYTDCKCLIDKFKTKVSNWKNKLLSYAGRLQLIVAILSSMQVYWVYVFILPKSVVKEIDRLLKGFLWCQGELSKGKAKVAWKQICRPKDEGGLGIKSLEMWNEVLMSKHLRNVATLKESLWVKWVNMNRVKDESIWSINYDKNASHGWNQILNLRDKMRNHIVSKISNGTSIFLWHDKWWGLDPITKFIPMEVIRNVGFEAKIKLKDMICDGKWKWPVEWNSIYQNITSIPVPCPDSTNHLFFECFYSKSVWKEMKEKAEVTNMPDKWDDIINFMTVRKHNRSIKCLLRKVTLAACVYFIWCERNKRLFTNEERCSKVLIEEITTHLRMKLASLSVKRTKQVEDIWLVLVKGIDLGGEGGCSWYSDALIPSLFGLSVKIYTLLDDALATRSKPLYGLNGLDLGCLRKCSQEGMVKVHLKVKVIGSYSLLCPR